MRSHLAARLSPVILDKEFFAIAHEPHRLAIAALLDLKQEVEDRSLPNESADVRQAREQYTRHGKAEILGTLRYRLWKANVADTRRAREAAEVYWQAEIDTYEANMASLSTQDAVATAFADAAEERAAEEHAYRLVAERAKPLGTRATKYLHLHRSVWSWLTPVQVEWILSYLSDDMDAFKDQLLEAGMEDDHVQYLVDCIKDDGDEAARAQSSSQASNRPS